MIIDRNLTLSTAQAITASAASTNLIDQGVAGDALGREPFIVVKTGLTAWTTCTSLVISVQTDSAVGFGTVETVLVSPTILLAALLASTELLKIRLPKGLKRYVRLYYTIAGSNAATATLDAFITPNIEVKNG